MDIIELYIPIGAFSLLFFSFIWAVAARYIFKQPCGWATDVELGCYIWVVLLSASYAMRQNRHVRFTMIYDAVGEGWQAAMRIVSHLLIIIPFSVLFWPTLRYILRLRLLSPALKLPVKFYYAPIVWFVGSTIIYSLIELVKDVRGVILKNRNQTAVADEKEEKIK